jgi:hypothetical protein
LPQKLQKYVTLAATSRKAKIITYLEQAKGGEYYRELELSRTGVGKESQGGGENWKRER